ncbi:MAG: glycine cleavage system protein GcvH [Elusimicrobiota bacterium]
MVDRSKLKFAKTHEWARLENGAVIVGITDFAQQEIRDIVYVELPKTGREVKQGEPLGVIESVKAAFEIYAPVSGRVVAVNDHISQDVTKIHKDPFGEGWLFKIEASSPAQLETLMNEADYQKITAESHR